MIKQYYVYRHLRLDRENSNAPFYVGKGYGYRIAQKCKRNNYWQNIVKSYGYKYEIIEYCESEEIALTREIYWIEYYKKLGYCEANLVKGGLGSSGLKFTEESKLKLSIAHLGKEFNVFCKHTGTLIGSWINISKCALDLQLHSANISSCLHGRYRTTGNYICKYTDDKSPLLFGDQLIREIRSLQKTVNKDICSRPSFRSKQSVAHGGGIPFIVSIIETSSIIGEYTIINECSRNIGVSRSSIKDCLKGKIRSCKGYSFKYKDRI